MIFAILPPRQKLKQDDELFYPGRALRRAYILVALAIAAIWAAVCNGCAFTLSDINTGVSAGRTFDTPFSTGKNTYQFTISGHYTRDRSP